jgi:hypothetical protein
MSEDKAAPQEYRVSRFRDGKRMAEGARVTASCENEALDKARRLFYPLEDGETFEIDAEMEAQGERCPGCASNDKATKLQVGYQWGEYFYCNNDWHSASAPATAAPSEEAFMGAVEQLWRTPGFMDKPWGERLAAYKSESRYAGHPSQEGPPAPSCTVCGVPMRKTWACSEHGGPIESGASEPRTAAALEIAEEREEFYGGGRAGVGGREESPVSIARKIQRLCNKGYLCIGSPAKDITFKHIAELAELLEQTLALDAAERELRPTAKPGEGK